MLEYVVYGALGIIAGKIVGTYVEYKNQQRQIKAAITDIQTNNRLLFEKYDDVYFAFNNNQFLAQGTSFDDITAQLKERFPNKVFVVDREHKAAIFGQ